MKINSFSIGSAPINEDFFVYRNMGINGYVIVLADGMGGLPHGDVAARIACKAAVEYIINNYKEFHSEKRILKEALKVADNAIATQGLAKYKCRMGTTIAIAIVSDYQIFYTWQGNVRIYLKKHNTLSVLTVDHILNINYDQKRVTRSIKGTGLREDIPVKKESLSRNDTIFFCTDGLYNIAASMLSDNNISEIKDIIINPEDDASLIQIDI